MTGSMGIGSRNDGGFRLRGMLVISFLLHTLMLSILLAMPMIPSPKLTFGPTYSVQLVSSPEVFRPDRSATSLAREIGGVAREKPVLLKNRMEAPPPIKTIGIRKERTEEVEKAIEKLRKKVAASSAAPSSPAKPQAQKDVAAPASSANQGNVDVKMQAYYAALWARIKGQWALPKGILPGDNLEAVLHARILGNGTLKEADFEKRSGNRFFDDSALKAIKKAAPFPPLPEWVREGSIEIGIRFHSLEAR